LVPDGTVGRGAIVSSVPVSCQQLRILPSGLEDLLREQRGIKKAGSCAIRRHKGVKIQYEVEGQGLPLVLEHALMASSENWQRAGYVDALKTDFRQCLQLPDRPSCLSLS
jgi:hypothetical protein